MLEKVDVMSAALEVNGSELAASSLLAWVPGVDADEGLVLRSRSHRDRGRLLDSESGGAGLFIPSNCWRC